MPEYRRLRGEGGTVFFTVCLRDRDSALLVERIELLRGSVARVRTLLPFRVDAWAVLPDHMHCVWTLPNGDGDFSRRWQVLKCLFSRDCAGEEAVSASRKGRRERGIWQRRFWDHMIRDERDYAAHVDYVHFNPVKHGFVPHPADWPYSTFRRSVARGIYPANWAGPDDTAAEWGERR